MEGAPDELCAGRVDDGVVAAFGAADAACTASVEEETGDDHVGEVETGDGHGDEVVKGD